MSPRIKLESLRVFQVVAEARGLAEAAESLSRTPAALSMTLRQLEDTLGARLFETERKNRLTPLGRFVLEQARLSVGTHERVVDKIERFVRGEAGTLRIAAVPSVANRLLPPVIARLHACRESLRMELRDIDSRAVVQSVLAGEVDLGIASAPIEPTPLVTTPLLEDPFHLVCRRDDPLAGGRTPLRWSDLHGRPFISNGLCDALDETEARALVARAHLRLHNVSSLFAFIEAGQGISVLPALAVPETEWLTSRPLAPPVPRRILSILQRGEETPAPVVGVLLDELRQEVKRFRSTRAAPPRAAPAHGQATSPTP